MRSTFPGEIDIESGPLESTGGKVWEASMRFFSFLIEKSIFTDEMNAKVLELGSGCGWLGMRLAKAIPGTSVTMSEQSCFGALDWLQHNIDLNPGLSVCGVELDWARIPIEICDTKWDFVIGAELVYSYEGARLLASVLRQILQRSGAICYYAHSLNRFESVDEQMFSEFTSNGLQVDVVYGQQAFDHSVGSFSELFRDLELVIFKITAT